MIEFVEVLDGFGGDLVLQTAFCLPRSCEIEFDASLVGSGWYASEMSGARPFRWMGVAECATVMLAIDRGVELVVSIEIMMTIDDACWSSFGFFLDGHPLSDEQVELRCGGADLILPASKQALSATELRICNAVRKVPAPDPRKLSVALSRLTVRPREDLLPEPSRIELRAGLAAYLQRLGDDAPLRPRGQPV